jgi:hypothetical protein
MTAAAGDFSRRRLFFQANKTAAKEVSRRRLVFSGKQDGGERSLPPPLVCVFVKVLYFSEKQQLTNAARL